MAGLGKTDGIMWHSEHDTTVAKGKKVKKNSWGNLFSLEAIKKNIMQLKKE